jgi:hypothetical protein
MSWIRQPSYWTVCIPSRLIMYLGPKSIFGDQTVFAGFLGRWVFGLRRETWGHSLEGCDFKCLFVGILKSDKNIFGLMEL